MIEDYDDADLYELLATAMANERKIRQLVGELETIRDQVVREIAKAQPVVAESERMVAEVEQVIQNAIGKPH
jgi:hypothetical protein